MSISGEPSYPTQQPPVAGPPLGQGIKLEASKPAVVRNPYSLEDNPGYTIESFAVTGQRDSGLGSSESDPTMINSVSASGLKDATASDDSLKGRIDPAILAIEFAQSSAKLTGTKDHFGQNSGPYPGEVVLDEYGPAGGNSTSS